MSNKPRRNPGREILTAVQTLIAVGTAAYQLIAPLVRKWSRKRKPK